MADVMKIGTRVSSSIKGVVLVSVVLLLQAEALQKVHTIKF